MGTLKPQKVADAVAHIGVALYNRVGNTIEKSTLSPQVHARQSFLVDGVKKEIIDIITTSREFGFSIGVMDQNRYDHFINTIKNNILILQENNIALETLVSDINHPLTRLYFTSHLAEGISIMNHIGVDNIMSLYDIIHNLDIHTDGKFHIGLFEECIEYYGKQYVRDIMTGYNQHAYDMQTGHINRDVIHNKQYMEAMMEAEKIITFCSHLSMPSGQGMPPITSLLSIEDFMTPVESTETDLGRKEVHYLGSYASEIRYIIEKLGIGFEVLFDLPKATIASYCGILRSLCNATYRGQGADIFLDFVVSRKPCDFSPKQLFTRKSFTHFLCHTHKPVIDPVALDKLKDFMQFITTHSTVKYPQLSERNIKYILSETKKRYERFKIQQQEEERLKKIAFKHHARKQARLGRNYGIVGELTKTLQAESPRKSLLGDEKTMIGGISKIPFLRSYTAAIRALDKKYAGLYSIGGKIHFPESISQINIDTFRKKYNFGSTPFQMIHANTSLLLPPSYFPEELMFMISCMSESGLFGDDPQLQISIPGRLTNPLGGILGSSMILLSNEHVEYSKESFDTTHNSDTGRRMVTYDAGVYDKNFKWNSDKISGRTDVLLLKDINLIPKAKVIGSLLSQTLYDGMFADLGMDFIEEYGELLVKYNLEKILTGPRIYTHDVDMHATLDEHYDMVKSLTDKHAVDRLMYQYTKHHQGLMTFEIKKLLTKYWKRIESIQQQFID